MKKKILLILILVVPLVIQVLESSQDSLRVQVEENGLSRNKKNIYWEYVKDKLYLGQVERDFVNPIKVTGPIFIELQNATAQDSISVKEVLKCLKETLPHKEIAYALVDTKSSASTIKIEFEPSTEKLISEDHELIRGVNYGSLDKNNSYYSKLYFTFYTNTSTSVRIKYIQYELFRSLCSIHKYALDSELLNINYPINALFNDPTYRVEDKEFTPIDVFLMQKLYADDFEKQFSNYMYKTYPWRYASVFLDKDLAALKVLLFIALIGVLTFVLGFGVFNNIRTNFLSYFFPILVVLWSFMNLNGLYVYLVDIDQGVTSLKNSVDLFSYVICSSALVSFFLWLIENKIMTARSSFPSQFVLKLLFTFVALNIPILIGYILGKTDGTLSIYIVLFFTFLVLTLGRGLLIYLNYFSDSLIQKKEIELRILKELNAENELKSLHAHINPHFLYNALNSIASLTQENAKKAEDMILLLSDLFRYSINRTGRKMSTIEDEVLMVRNYFKIEKIRFDERLNFTIEVEEELLKKEIPRYLLQPLVENSVKHGISKIKNKGDVQLIIKEVHKNIQIEIFDSGPAFPEDLFAGYGLQSIYDLLRLSYGENAMLHWENAPKKKIMILIPLKK